MEKDFNKEVSNSDYSSGENAEDKELSAIEEEILFLVKQQSLKEQLEKLAELSDENDKNLASLRTLLPNDPSQFQTSPLQSVVSPIASPIQARLSEILSEVNSPDSTILTDESRQPDILFPESITALTKQSEYLTNKLQSLHETVDSLTKLLPEISSNETKASGSPTELDSESGFEVIDKDAESVVYKVGKGKGALNPKFRYSKGSRKAASRGSSGKEADKPAHKFERESEADVSSLAKDTPAKSSEEASSTSESKSPRHDSQESKSQLEKSSPAAKRKTPDSNKNYPYRQRLDESVASTSGVSIFSGNLSDDDEDLTIAKKLKFEEGGDLFKKDLTLRELLQKTTHERLDLRQFMQPDELQSRSPQLSAGGYTSNSEDSCSGNASDVVTFRGDSPDSLTSVSDISPGEREESSLTSVSDLSSGEREESALRSAIEGASLCGVFFSKYIQSEDKSRKAKDETTSDEESPSKM